nr:hypothetical protein [uncultured Flavobacterium sp.]
MIRGNVFLLLLLMTLISCTTKDDVVEVQPKGLLNEIEGGWVLTTRIVQYEGETFVEDLRVEQCDSYNSYSFENDQDLQLQSFDSENDCQAVLVQKKWELDSTTKILEVTEVATSYKVVYKVEEVSKKHLKLKILSEGGDQLEGTGFDVYLILVK